MVLKIRGDLTFWHSLTDNQQYLLTRFFIDSPEQDVTRGQIAKELGVDGSTISRGLERLRRGIRRYTGSTTQGSRLLYKPRHLLPR